MRGGGGGTNFIDHLWESAKAGLEPTVKGSSAFCCRSRPPDQGELVLGEGAAQRNFPAFAFRERRGGGKAT